MWVATAIHANTIITGALPFCEEPFAILKRCQLSSCLILSCYKIKTNLTIQISQCDIWQLGHIIQSIINCKPSESKYNRIWLRYRLWLFLYLTLYIINWLASNNNHNLQADQIGWRTVDVQIGPFCQTTAVPARFI